MGWYTDKSKRWELKNMWGLYLTLGSVFIFPLFFIGFPAFITICMGIVVKKRSWVIFGVLNIIGSIIGLVFYLQRLFNILDAGLNEWIFYILWPVLLLLVLPFINCVYNLFKTKEYLQRLTIKSQQPLGWNKKYDYNGGTSEARESLTPKEVFIIKLQTHKNNINNLSVNNNIEKMINLVNIIAGKDQMKSEVFLSRHADTIENVLKQYEDIENAGIENSVIIDSKKHLEEVMNQATKAFEQELINQVKKDILTVSAESDAYIQHLKNKGLLDN